MSQAFSCAGNALQTVETTIPNSKLIQDLFDEDERWIAFLNALVRVDRLFENLIRTQPLDMLFWAATKKVVVAYSAGAAGDLDIAATAVAECEALLNEAKTRFLRAEELGSTGTFIATSHGWEGVK